MIHIFSKAMGVSVEDLKSRKHGDNLALLRAIYSKIRREGSKDSWKEIANELGRKNHSSAMVRVYHLNKQLREGDEEAIYYYRKAVVSMPRISIEEAQSILSEHNRWRRGEIEKTKLTPKQIGEAIDRMLLI